MGFETFNDPARNANLERVAHEVLMKPDIEEALKAKEDLEREANFAAIDKNFGIEADGEKKNESEDILLEQKLKFRITNTTNRLKELESGVYTGADLNERVEDLKEILQESEEDLRKIQGFERNLESSEDFSVFDERDVVPGSIENPKASERKESVIESIGEFTRVDYELWKKTLPDILVAFGFYVKERENNPLVGMHDITYFIDENGDHFYSYTDDEDSKRYATKLSVGGRGYRLQELVNPELFDKSLTLNGDEDLDQSVLAKSYQSYLSIYNDRVKEETEAMSLYQESVKDHGEDDNYTKMKKTTWNQARERREEASRMMLEIAKGFSTQTKERFGIV
jgi:hypothetical protein